ncbi:MAG TPA: elongation factor G [Gemmatimonadaceae bacterium]|nr:elongation factor G [Gemmatimonadaceae bacterium]
MREYKSGDIRNVAVVGHGASGKTTLVDALAFVSGSSRRHGSVKDGTALTDTSPEEIARGYSIGLACAHAEWRDTKINLLDTPGYADFAGDAMAGLAAADGALVAVGSTGGVEVGTERMFRAAVRRADPVLFVVSMMDKENADFDAAYASIKARLTPKVVPVEIPIGSGPSFRGVINLFTKRAQLFKPGTKSGAYEDADIPAEERERFERYHTELTEAVAASDDALLERFFAGEELPGDDEMLAMKSAMKRAELFPLLCCSGQLTYGVPTVLDFLVQLMPSAYEMEEAHALHGAEGSRTVEVHAREDAPFCGLVFKTTNEPHVGDVSFIRTFSGMLTNGAEVFNATRGSAEKLTHLTVPQGKERTEVPQLHPGDIGCVAKLRGTHTNDTLSTREHPVRLPGIPFPDPLVSFAIEANARADEEKLQLGLHRLHEEDPTIQVHFEAETHETIIEGLGERHLEVALARLERNHGVKATLRRPRVPYRETLQGVAEGQGRHKKQTGGKGQFGDCWIRIKPASRGAGYQFVDKISGGVIPRNYIPAVDKGVQEAAERGVLAGYPVVDFTVECFDGSYHAVDSNEASFRMAGILAFRSIAAKAKPVLLEPLMSVEVLTPDDALGDVLGDLSSRRAHIVGTAPSKDGDGMVVQADVPMAELHLYASRLQSITHGYGSVRYRLKGFEPVPPELAEKVVGETAARP